MADYSGYWSCSACPAHGDGYGTDRPHDDSCPNYLAAVRRANQKRLEEERDAATKQAWLDYYATLDLDVLYDQMWETQLEAGDRYGRYHDVKQQYDLMLDSLRRRDSRALHGWLDYTRKGREELRAAAK